MWTHVLEISFEGNCDRYYLRKVDTAWFLGPEGKMPCIRIDIHNTEGVAVIDMINYFSHCNVSQTMAQKGGTQLMLKAMLLCMKKRHPSIGRFVFSDNSQIPCGDKGAVDLAGRNLLLHGRTWYMEMGATPSDDLLMKVYERAARRVGRLVNMSFEDFSKTRGVRSSSAFDDIQRLHEACYQYETWKQFFRRL
jgi:hypothetical protein